MDDQILFEAACSVIPGGVNSPVRAFRGVDGTPVFIDSAKGAYLYGADGKTYIDYIGSWGPMILGHAHPEVVKAVQDAAENSLSFGLPTQNETKLAQLIAKLMPSIEQVRLVNSGTEATMSAIRLARAYTGRNKIIKFNGCYHGHADSLLVKAGSGLLTLGIPSTPGIPESVTKNTLCADFNNIAQVEMLFKQHGDDIACIIVEPIAGNMNCILPNKRFLAELRELCDHYQSLLIFDEVMSGFRVALGGAQALYHVTPDLTTLGKVIGGGLPVGAFGGKTDIMQLLAPSGDVYQAGTLSGNPMAMAAGIKQLELIQEPGFYDRLGQTSGELTQGLQELATQANINLYTCAIGGMFGFLFIEEETITCFEQIKQCDLRRFKYFFHEMLKRGIYFAPSAFEAGFVSSKHGTEETTMTLDAAKQVFSTMGSV